MALHTSKAARQYPSRVLLVSLCVVALWRNLDVVLLSDSSASIILEPTGEKHGGTFQAEHLQPLKLQILHNKSITQEQRGVEGMISDISPHYHSSRASASVKTILDPPDIRLLWQRWKTDPFQFPSVEDRVRYYMGGWYEYQQFNVTTACQTATRYGVDTQEPNLLYQTLLVTEGLVARPKTRWYMADVYDQLLSQMRNSNHTTNHPGMLLVQFGDLRDYFDLPVLVKSRLASRLDLRTTITMEKPRFDFGGIQPIDPIVAPLNMHRHFYEPIERMYRAKNGKKINPDRPWKNKTDILVWRGSATGLKHGNQSSSGQDLSRVRLLMDIFETFRDDGGDDGSTNSNRFHTADDILYDIGFTNLIQIQREHQPSFDHLVKPRLTLNRQLQHKYLLNLEGNDVSSGLKWMLLSNSVVFMPVPTCVSWAMEEWLQPWYHYVPLRDDLQDLVEKIQWCRDHDVACRRISLQATKYMNDLWTSSRARQDHQTILTQMMHRYQQLYGQDLASCSFNNK